MTETRTIRAGQALLPEGWARDVTVNLGADGRIAAVDAGADGRRTAQTRQVTQRVDILLPAPVNLHSHAFQRAMAGMTERRGPDPRDTFWTWRQLMFRFLDRLTPAHVEAITAFVQIEMLEAGYAGSVEFHYLHHRPGGAPYDDLAEMSGRVAAAAATSGIGLTLAPVLYEVGGCEGSALGPGQVRFGNDMARFGRLHEGAGAALAELPADAVLAAAPHSLRAVRPDDLRGFAARFPAGPLHMHLAEQVAEVEQVQAHWGARPVDWALDEIGVDGRWCLIHCTQMTPAETGALARSGAVAGLCPITESNLGDGIFDAVRWFGAGGATGIGSDSNVRIALAEELRTLDYSQRLRDRSRAALATPELSTGRRLYDAVLAGGARAAGRDSGALRVGCWADMLALDGATVDLEGLRGDALLDAWIFAGDDRMVREVWSAGRHLVTDGRHRGRGAIEAAYRRALADLRAAL